MSTAWFLAGKYLRPRRNAVSVITLISVIGVTLGVAVLVIVLAVMTGFTDLMKSKLLDTQAHFHVRGYGGISDPESVLARIREAGAEGAPVVQSPALVQLGQMLDAQIVVFGVDEQDVRKYMKVDGALKSGTLKLGRGEVIISSEMARRWGVQLGDRILLHAPNRLTGLVRFKPEGGVELNPDSPVYLPTEFRVTGIYSFGKYDFDRSVIFVGRDDAAELFGLPWGGASIIYGWVREPFNMEADLEKLRDALDGLVVTSWQEENRQLLDRISELENRLENYRAGELFLRDSSRFEPVDSLGCYIYRNARVINNSIVRRHNFLTLDKGRRNGIEKDMAVTQNGMLVGYVLHVSDKFAVCMSLLNTDFKTSGRGLRGDYDGSIRWDGIRYDHATLSEIPRYAEINVGDTIVTTSFSSRFPEGIGIGTVESFELINGTYYEADIRLFTRFGALRYVDVIRYKDMEERRLLEEMIENDI